jgi:hypothetical protein
VNPAASLPYPEEGTRGSRVFHEKAKAKGRDEESGKSVSKNPPAQGDRNAGKVMGATREVSSGRRLTTGESCGISCEAKSAVTPGEKSDEVIVPMMVKTTKLYLGKDLYFNSAFVRR